LKDIRACIFDAYGTLFDFNSAVAQHRERLGDVADRFSAMWRTKQLEYTWLRSLMHRHADFGKVTQDALDYTLDTFGIADDGLRRDLIGAYLQLDVYPDVRDALAELKRAGMHTGILSNGSPMMLQAAVASAEIDSLIDDVWSVEQAGVYKPDPRVYQIAVDALRVRPDQIAFQSANAWDAVGAASVGLRAVWVNRFGHRAERLPAQPEAEIKSLTELPGLLGL